MVALPHPHRTPSAASFNWIVALVAVMLATSLALGGPDVTPAAAASTCVDGWKAMPIRKALKSAVPIGAAAVAGQPGWWVGKSSTNQWPVIAQWRKNAWRPVPVPWSKEGGLTAVSASSANDAWTVGYLKGSSPRPISAHWDGAAWHNVAITSPSSPTTLVDVVALPSGGAWAVGAQISLGRTIPVAMVGTSAGWADVSPAIANNQEAGLTAVARAPDGRIWSAGWRATDGSPAPWIAYWDGAAWQSSPVLTGPGFGYLTDIDFGGHDDGWAAGYAQQATGGYGPLLVHLDENDWQPAELPWDETSAVLLTTLSVTGEESVIVGGTRLGNGMPATALGAGGPSEWRTASPGMSTYPGSWIKRSAAIAGGAFAVGSMITKAGAYITCSGGSSTTASTTNGPPPVKLSTPSDRGVDGGIDPDPSSAVDAPTGSTGGLSDVAAGPPAGIFGADMTAVAHLDMRVQTYSGVVADFNGDGWPDVFVNRHISDVPLLELGGPSGFSAAPATFMFNDRHGCAAADVNDNGMLDLMCVVGRRRGTMLARQELLLDIGSSGGTQATAEFGLLDPSGRGRWTTFVHLLSDPLPALYVMNDPIRSDALSGMNRFYRNVGATHFEPAPSFGLDSSMGGSCLEAADLNGDGNDELLMCINHRDGDLAAGARIFGLDGAHFVDRTHQLGLAPMGEQSILAADFDGDGRLDLARMKKTRLVISLQRDAGFVDSFSLTLKGAQAMAVGDVNGDGRADVYVRANKTQLMLVNGGDGTSFDSLALPPVLRGSADAVLALDYDHNGLTDFLTLNGRYSSGPLQLIAFFPSAH